MSWLVTLENDWYMTPFDGTDDKTASNLLAIGEPGTENDEQRIDEALRELRAIKFGAGFSDHGFDELASNVETVLDLLRSGQLVPSAEVAAGVLQAFNKLRAMANDPELNPYTDIAKFVAVLETIQTLPS